MSESEQPVGGETANLRRASILEYLAVVARNKRLILVLTGASVFVAVLLLFLVFHRWYKSTAVVMPPKQKNALGLMSSIARATAPLRSIGLGSSSDDMSQLQTVVASRRVKEAVIAKFDLMKVYDTPNMERTVAELDGNFSVVLGKEDASLEISVLDMDPVRAAEMANYFVECLDRVYLEMSVTEAKRNREFLERRYNQNLSDLKKAEDDFRAFQTKYGVYSVPDQVKAAVEAAALLESRKVLKEVQLGMLAETTTEDNPQRVALAQEVTQLRKQLNIMTNGDAHGKSGSVVFAPFAKTPEIGIEYLRRFREIEIQSKLLEFLMPLYEQAKIEEQRDTPSVIVLDPAVPPVKHDRPKRMIILAVVILVSLTIGFFIALLRESLARARTLRTPEEAERLAMIKRELHPRNLFR